MEATPQSSLPKDIKVKILLAGGHEYTVFLQPDSQLLQSLIDTMVARTQPLMDPPQGLFQVPLEQGRSALCFTSEHLVGLVTEPALYIQQNQPLHEEILIPDPIETIQKGGSTTPTIYSDPFSTHVLPSEYVLLDNFLAPDELDHLIHYVLQREPDFVPTSTSTNDASYRRSLALYSFPEFSTFMIEKIRAIAPDVLDKLGLPTFRISEIEAQLTSHNDGNYYKIHNDNGSLETATRELTYVYYFYREPKAFSGGELRIYDSKIENGYYVGAESFKTIEPRNNSIIFFLSRYLHEVLPVRCPSRSFADSRFTINGWVRRSS